MEKVFDMLQELEAITYYMDGSDPAVKAVHEAINEALIITYTNFIKKENN